MAAAPAAGVKDEPVLAAIATVPRSGFVPSERAELANVDTPIPIPHEQVTTQPSLVARMVEALALGGEERVLEIAMGYGWQTALLARLAREVFGVERFADLAESARRALAACENVRVVVGDGTQGLPEHAPFRRNRRRGRVPAGTPPARRAAHRGRAARAAARVRRGRGRLPLQEARRPLGRVRSVSGAHFVRLHGRHGFP